MSVSHGLIEHHHVYSLFLMPCLCLDESKFTNLAAYMDGLVVPPPNGSTDGSSLSATNAIAQYHPSASNSVLTPPRLVLPDNSLPTR